MALKKD